MYYDWMSDEQRLVDMVIESYYKSKITKSLTISLKKITLKIFLVHV